jgi:hypothetical protein
MSNKAKITLLEKPVKYGNSRVLHIKDQGTFYVPETTFFGYNPATKQAEIESWILDQKGIVYKV